MSRIEDKTPTKKIPDKSFEKSGKVQISQNYSNKSRLHP
jgi:hypothetical protein